MDNSNKTMTDFERVLCALQEAEGDESFSPLRKAALLDEYADLLADNPQPQEDSAEIKQRACAIRAEHYRKELESDTTPELELRRLLRQSGAPVAAISEEDMNSVDDFEQMLVERSARKAKASRPGKTGTARLLTIVFLTLCVLVSVGGVIFISMHAGPLARSAE